MGGNQKKFGSGRGGSPKETYGGRKRLRIPSRGRNKKMSTGGNNLGRGGNLGGWTSEGLGQKGLRDFLKAAQ